MKAAVLSMVFLFASLTGWTAAGDERRPRLQIFNGSAQTVDITRLKTVACRTEWKRTGRLRRECDTSIIHRGDFEYQLGAVTTYATMEIYFQWLRRKPAFEAEADRMELLIRLNAV